MLHPDLARFVAFGEVRIDLVRDADSSWRSACAGSPWQVAMAMSSLGELSAYAGAISSDLFGQEIWRACTDANLDLRFLQQLPRPPLLNFIDEEEAPDGFFIGADSADLHFRPESLPAGWVKALRWAHFGGLGLVRPPLAQRLEALAEGLKAEGKKISYAPGFRSVMDSRYDDSLKRMCSLADVIKVSTDDLLGLFRSADYHSGLAQISAWNPGATLLLTRGTLGATLYCGAGEWHAAPPQLESLIDGPTRGLGDASTAGLLFSLIHEPNAAPEQHLRWAVAAASAACSAASDYALPRARPWTLPPALVATLAAAVRVLPGA
ncbi:PfkB family carbohydrate kinase [Roseateles oligotrophus]|uniref:PfkB family carbohydrate kinase n=1 Tax=Roseateles oligotrophus TaxID=1769250 RepID=A0ABT2Y985_9BURK|nr:PfkB family carbohydrate kinase [Roseateles oligotrophus]MCV2366864.1 PfkB family carbohydrate kinase [Roseateles oligotrophus]